MGQSHAAQQKTISTYFLPLISMTDVLGPMDDIFWLFVICFFAHEILKIFRINFFENPQTLSYQFFLIEIFLIKLIGISKFGGSRKN